MIKVMKMGSRGQDVKNLQSTLNTFANKLNRKDFHTGSADGVFGSKTFNALKNFQYAIGVTSDGIAGAKTQDAINQVGVAIVSGKQVSLRGSKPQSSPGVKATASSLSPKPSVVSSIVSGNFMDMFGSVNWKLVGMMAALGVGLLFMVGGKKSPKRSKRRRKR